MKKSKKLWVGMFVVCFVTFTLASAVFAQTQFAIGTASATGTWYPLGAALSKIINDNVKGVTVTVESTKGGMANVHLLAKKELEGALVPSWAIADAFKGKGDYARMEGFPAKVAGWFSFAPNDLTILVPKNSEIKSIRDFKGKRINLGAPGTFNRPILKMVLEEYGLSTEDVKGYDIAVGPAVNRLKNRQLDAVWWWAATPASAFTDASVSIETRLIPVEAKMVAKITKKYPWFNVAVIPGNTYKGTAGQTKTLFTKITAAMISGVDSNLVYQMTKAIFENLDSLGRLHPIFKKLTKGNALEGIAIPLHPGALRYYTEMKFPGVEEFVAKFGKL